MCRPNESRSMRMGFSLTELLVVMAIISMLTALILPAIQKLRESARTTVSRNNLRQMALATSTFLDERGSYPQTTYFSGTMRSGSAGTNFFNLLPFLEQKNLWEESRGISGTSPCGIQYRSPTPGDWIYYASYNPYTYSSCRDYSPFRLNLPAKGEAPPPPPIVNTFIAPNDPSLPTAMSRLNGNINDYVNSPTSYAWNSPQLTPETWNSNWQESTWGQFTPKDLVNGASRLILITEAYSYCGHRVGWNYDSSIASWSSAPPPSNCTSSCSPPFFSPIASMDILIQMSPATRTFWPPNPRSWQIQPPTNYCNNMMAQAFLRNGSLNAAFYDGSVRSLDPTINQAVFNALTMNDPTQTADDSIDW